MNGIKFLRYHVLIFNYANSIRQKHVLLTAKLKIRKLTKQQQLIQREIRYLVQYVDIKQSNE